MAAGFSLAPARLAEFHAFLDERLAAAALLPSAADLAVEGTLAVPGATTELAHQLARLAPFGAGNEEPMLVLQRARVVRADRVGREGDCDPRVRRRRGRRAAAEGDAVPRPRRRAGRGAACGQRYAAASRRPSARRGMERCGQSGLRHRRHGGGLTLREALRYPPLPSGLTRGRACCPVRLEA